MSFYQSLAGERIVSADVVTPYYGAWVGDVILASSLLVADHSSLVIGDLTLDGSSVRQASFAGTRSVRLCGAAGWRKDVAAQAYVNTKGIKRSIVLRDAASLVGETVTFDDDPVIGPAFVRESGPASRVLRQVAGNEWWVDPTGVTHIGARPTSLITSDFTIIKWSGGKGMFEVATEHPADWMPGRTFTSATVDTPQMITFVRLTTDGDGVMRLFVLSGGAA